jgi:hypothetical protein
MARDARTAAVATHSGRASFARLAPLVAAAGSALACVVALAWGSADTSSMPPSVAVNRNLVQETDIDATRAGSPGRALLGWFRAVQLDDAAGVRNLTAPDALRALEPARLASDVHLVAPIFAKPQIVATRVAGARAAVRVRLLSYEPGRVKPVLSIPATIALVEVDGRWRMADLALVVNGARAVRRARQAP